MEVAGGGGLAVDEQCPDPDDLGRGGDPPKRVNDERATQADALS